MHTVFLALGANFGDKKKHIEDAIRLLQEKIVNIEVAKLYETKPWGFTDQDYFLNTAVKGKTDLSPEALLPFLKSIEQKVGRVQRFRWGPREIDIDIIFYDDTVFQNDGLEIPHPRAHERDFVLQPIVDLDPDIIHPTYKKTVKELLSLIPQKDRSIIS